MSSIQSRREVEKWYPVEKSICRESPSIWLKVQYQSVDILPLRDYDLPTKYLNDEYNTLCQILARDFDNIAYLDLCGEWL